MTRVLMLCDVGTGKCRGFVYVTSALACFSIDIISLSAALVLFTGDAPVHDAILSSSAVLIGRCGGHNPPRELIW